jgi:hypothetical protein
MFEQNIPKTKKCKICDIEKPFKDFYPLKSGKYGIDSVCKECNKQENKKFNRTEKGLIYHIFRNLKKQARKNQKVLNFERNDFYNWLIDNELYLDLYKSWISNDYNEEHKPACYKIDYDSPYTLSNLGLATSKNVKDKYFKDIKAGKNLTFSSKFNKPIIQRTKEGKFIQKFNSIQDAERYLQETNNDSRTYNTGITACKNGRSKTAYGYVWEEDTTPIEKTLFGEKIQLKQMNNYLLEDIENILGEEISINTEKEELIKCRIGQGKFREKLIEYWKGCSITGFNDLDLLMASHIKPWRASSSEERLDVYNGLLLR